MNKFIRRCLQVFILLAIFPLLLSGQTTPTTKPIRIKVAVVAMFERGEDTGDTPGEYQLWVEREHLDQVIPLPAGSSRAREQRGSTRLLTGAGTAKAAPTSLPAILLLATTAHTTSPNFPR